MKTYAIRDMIYNYIRNLFFQFEEIFKKKDLRLPNYPGHSQTYLSNVLIWTKQSITFLSHISCEELTTIEFFKKQISSIERATEECVELEK
jgi:hypothetical protein